MIVFEQNNRIYQFQTKEEVTTKRCNQLKITGLPSGLIYASMEELESYEFQTTIDAECTSTQHLGQPYEKDGNYYRDAVDNPVIEPEITIDSRIIKDKIGKLFEPRGIEFQVNYPAIMDNIKDEPIPMYAKNLTKLKGYSQAYLDSGIINQVEFDAFRQIFIDSGYNLNDY